MSSFTNNAVVILAALTFIVVTGAKLSTNEIAQQFKNQDANNNGKIDKPEFTKFLQTEDPQSAKQADQLFQTSDKDKSGSLDLGEVQRQMQH